MLVQDPTEMFLNLNHHPVCAAEVASRDLFLIGAATLPGQEGRWPGPAIYTAGQLDYFTPGH